MGLVLDGVRVFPLLIGVQVMRGVDVCPSGRARWAVLVHGGVLQRPSVERAREESSHGIERPCKSL